MYVTDRKKYLQSVRNGMKLINIKMLRTACPIVHVKHASMTKNYVGRSTQRRISKTIILRKSQERTRKVQNKNSSKQETKKNITIFLVIVKKFSIEKNQYPKNTRRKIITNSSINQIRRCKPMSRVNMISTTRM